MKKVLAALVLSCAAAFGQQPSPELLKNKENFSKTELFEPNEVFADKAANAARMSYIVVSSAFPDFIFGLLMLTLFSSVFPIFPTEYRVVVVLSV